MVLEEPPLKRIKKTTFDQWFRLRETEQRKQEQIQMRNSISQILEGLKAMSWKVWKNPFATVITII